MHWPLTAQFFMWNKVNWSLLYQLQYIKWKKSKYIMNDSMHIECAKPHKD